MAYLNDKKILMGAKVTINNLPVDQDYNPESEKAQSGKAVAQALLGVSGGSGGTWETIANITIPEEVNTVICADTNTFADIGKVGDFYMLITIPVHATQSTGHLYIDINGRCVARVQDFDTSYAYKCTNQFYSINIPNISRINICGMKFNANETSNINLTTTCAVISTAISDIKVRLATASSMLPIGTKIKIVGRVEQ